MQSKPTTVAKYLAALPADRRAAIQKVRETILANLDSDYEEGIQYGMIGYYVPHRVFPAGYHTDPKQPLPFAGLAAQKNHMAVYLLGVYSDPNEDRWFRQAWAQTGKKLDMGKSCVRFKKLEDLPLDVIGQAIQRLPAKTYVAQYQQTLAGTAKGAAKKTAAKKKTATKKSPARKAAKTPAKKAARRKSKAR